MLIGDDGMVSVLIVDDSLFMRKFERQALSGSGYNVVGEATNGDEAVSMCGEFRPDVVLLDIVMSGGKAARTGLDALKQLVTEFPSTKVVVCSSLDQQAIIASALKLGAKGFIAKPFDPDELSEVISTCMELDVLLEIGSMGAGHAANALSEIVKEKVSIEVPRLQTGPPHLLPRIFAKHEQSTTAILSRLRGSVDCDVILAFEAEEAKKIAATVMTSSSMVIDAEMGESTIEEMGSIMICSFLSAMADFVSLQLVPEPPQTVTDSFDSIIDNLIANQALVSKNSLIFETHFRRSSASAEGLLLMFPSKEFQKLLINEGKKWLGIDVDASNLQNLDTIARSASSNTP